MAETVERPMVERGDAPPQTPEEHTERRRLAIERGRARRITRGQRTKALVLAYTALGHTAKEIGKELGLEPSTVSHIRYQLRRDGRLNNVIELIEKRAVPDAAEQLIEAIGRGEEWAVTKTLQGRGYLASGAGANSANLQSGPPPPLIVNVVLAPGVPANDPRLKPIPGNIVGTPRLSGTPPPDDAEKA